MHELNLQPIQDRHDQYRNMDRSGPAGQVELTMLIRAQRSAEDVGDLLAEVRRLRALVDAR